MRPLLKPLRPKLYRHVFGSLTSVAIAPDLKCILSVFLVWGAAGGVMFRYFSGYSVQFSPLIPTRLPPFYPGLSVNITITFLLTLPLLWFHHDPAVLNVYFWCLLIPSPYGLQVGSDLGFLSVERLVQGQCLTPSWCLLNKYRLSK